MTARSKGLPKISLILVLAAGMCPSSHAAELTTVPAESSFFDAIAGMVNWFSDLSAKIEHLKTSADRKQLIVRVRRIHEALVNLEQDKQTLADSIAESNL